MDVKFVLFLRHNNWNVFSKSEIFNISGLGGYSTGCRTVIKMIPFYHKMRHSKTINTKLFSKSIKHFLYRIFDNFYGNLTRNKKVRGKKYSTRIPWKTVCFKTCFSRSSFINKALFIILTNHNISTVHQNKAKFRNFP